jgi:signal transduction histidine kinase
MSLVPLGDVIQSGIEAARPRADKRGHTLTIGDLAGLPYIVGDGARLSQVFAILVGNAVKFTPDGGEIQVRGRLVSSLADREEVEVVVRDRGIGIDQDQQDLIFEKFYRSEDPLLHSSDESRFKGAGPGLGLPIARGIVTAHGGRIWVESPGRDEESCPGSTFYVRLPVSPPAEE